MTPFALRPWSLALALSLAAPSLATAMEPGPGDDAASARVAELNESGAKFYAERSYRRAIEKFIEAYAIDHDPNLLFNIARCYEELGETDAAIEKYRAFIAAPGADTDGRLRAQDSLKALEKLRADGPAPAAPSPENSDAPSADASSTPADSPSSGSFLPWVALGAGVLATGLGTTLYVLGVRDHDRVTSAPGYGDPGGVHPMKRSEARDLVAAGDTKKVIGGIGLGLGGALIATGAALFLSGKSEPPAHDTSALHLVVDPGPQKLSLTVSGSF
jgi:tetratricopeptide (TPR) repeat protein